MNKEQAKKILETPDQDLIDYWETIQFKDYLTLLQMGRSPEWIAEKVKSYARDIVEGKVKEENIVSKLLGEENV